MTEADWLSCPDPGRMLEFVRPWTSDRKRRLFAVGCCRRVWHMLDREESRVYVEVAEQFADREVGYEALKEQERLADHSAWLSGFVVISPRYPAWLLSADLAAAMGVVRDPIDSEGVASAVEKAVAWEFAAPRLADKDYSAWRAAVQAARLNERGKQRDLVRCVFGNPFRPVAVKPAWLTSPVVGLARAIYEERAFDRLPELADALRGAGCEHAEIQAHCREHPSHVRGCWVVDSILGKS